MELVRRQTEYAIRALVHLAVNYGHTISAAEIAEQQQVPLDYLQKIMQRLVRRGLVTSSRGAQGGFSLAREPKGISVLEIMEVMQGKINVNKCFLNQGGCPRAGQCRIKSKWQEVQEGINRFLEGLSLQDLVDQYQGKV